MIITIPDDKYPCLSGNAVKVLGYYQQCQQPITESAKVMEGKIGLGFEAINTARNELELLGLIQVTRPNKRSISILLINC